MQTSGRQFCGHRSGRHCSPWLVHAVDCNQRPNVHSKRCLICLTSLQFEPLSLHVIQSWLQYSIRYIFVIHGCFLAHQHDAKLDELTWLLLEHPDPVLLSTLSTDSRLLDTPEQTTRACHSSHDTQMSCNEGCCTNTIHSCTCTARLPRSVNHAAFIAVLSHDAPSAPQWAAAYCCVPSCQAMLNTNQPATRIRCPLCRSAPALHFHAAPGGDSVSRIQRCAPPIAISTT